MLLLIAMLALLVTSVLISNALSGFMSAYGGFTVRQIHTLAAYWVLVIVSIHLGLRWPMIMGVARNLLGISKASAVRTLALRAAAVVIAIHGVWSSFELGLGTKLAMQVTLDWWNFEESVLGFFVHCIAIAGLYMALTYYAVKWIQHGRRRDGSGIRTTQHGVDRNGYPRIAVRHHGALPAPVVDLRGGESDRGRLGA